MLTGKSALLLDMNDTFMFGEDRFGESEDYSAYYYRIGGTLPRDDVNRFVRKTYDFLDVRYSDERYRHCFPSVKEALREVAGEKLDGSEREKIIETFAFHELGYIPNAYARALHGLGQRFRLAVVIDIWSPKAAWLKAFEKAGIAGLFSAMSFSSDHGMVKPSPEPFERLVEQLGVSKAEAVVVGDSPTRDLGGALYAGIDCILVGGAKHPNALASYTNLLELYDSGEP